MGMNLVAVDESLEQQPTRKIREPSIPDSGVNQTKKLGDAHWGTCDRIMKVERDPEKSTKCP